MKLLALLLLPCASFGGEALYSSKDAAAAALKSLRSSGATSVMFFVEDGKPFRLTWDEPKSGAVLAPASDVAAKDLDLARARDLFLLWDAGRISPEDELWLRRFIWARVLGIP